MFGLSVPFAQTVGTPLPFCVWCFVLVFDVHADVDVVLGVKRSGTVFFFPLAGDFYDRAFEWKPPDCFLPSSDG
jgi:hypothetical protein